MSERILKKTPEQKALIRKHLEKFCGLYTGMSSRLEEFVDLFPIHPSYIDVFNKLYLIENRHILKNISTTIKDIFDTNVPENAPGIISFDNYWPAIKSNGLLKSDPTAAVRQSLERRLHILLEEETRASSMSEADLEDRDIEDGDADAMQAVSLDRNAEIEELKLIISVAKQAEFQHPDVKVEAF